MFDIRPMNFDLDLRMTDRPAISSHAILHHRALALFNRARRQAFFERARSLLLGHAHRLLDLGAIPCSQVHSRHYGGIKAVNISQICGSLDRVDDFDHHFQPRSDRLRDRWVGVAVARCQGTALPAVSLVQVSDRYFVEDGHHRLSVARALGESCIDAEVTIWEVSGPLPWGQGADQGLPRLALLTTLR